MKPLATLLTLCFFALPLAATAATDAELDIMFATLASETPAPPPVATQPGMFNPPSTSPKPVPAMASHAAVPQQAGAAQAEIAQAPMKALVPSQGSFEVHFSDAEAAIGAALAQKGIGDKIGAMMDGRSSRPIFAYGEPLQVQARGLRFDTQKGRWQASLMFVNEKGDVVSAFPASGIFHEMVEVPVLRRQLRNGEQIAQNDIELRDFIRSQTRPDTITDIATLIGKTPTHGISAFRPVRESEITGTPLVKRDAIVQLRYAVPGMEITTPGQVITQGARGDVIEVRNTASKKIVRGVVESASSVTVYSPSQQTSALTGEARVAN